MRLFLATLLGAAAAALGVGALAAANLRAFVDAHRGELVARAERALGRPLAVADVAPAWWPPGVRLTDVVLGDDPRFGETPLARVRAVRLTVRPWALFTGGRLEADGVVLEQPTLHLVRDPTGRWNVTALGASDDGGGQGGERPRRPHAPRISIAWMLGGVLRRVEDARVEVEDHAGPTERRLVFERVRVRLHDARLGGDARLRVHGALANGAVDLDLRVPNLGARDARDTPFWARLTVDDLELPLLAAWTGKAAAPVGRLGGLAVDAGGTLEQLTLAFDARAAGAPIRLGAGVTLPPLPATVRGQATYDHGRLVLVETEGTLGSLPVLVSGELRSRPWRGALEVRSRPGSAAEVAAGEAPLRVSDVELPLRVGADATRLQARFRLDGVPSEVEAAVTSLEPPILDGRFAVGVFGGTLAGTIAIPPPPGRLRFDAEVLGVDVAALVAHTGGEWRDRVAGRAGLALSVTMPAAAGSLRALAGSGSASLTGGRLVGLSVAERLLARLADAVPLPDLVAARTQERVSAIVGADDTVVRTGAAAFTIAGGRLAIERLEAITDAYEIRGRGTLDLERELRFDGDLFLGTVPSAALRREVPALRYLAAADGRLVLPFRVRGILGRAEAEPDAKRLRKRGLHALMEATAERRRSSPLPGAEPQGGPAPDEPVLERLERMLRP